MNAYFYNSVGDLIYCEIRNKNNRTLQITGPVYAGDFYTYNWDPVFYNGSTASFYISTAKVKFADGTTKTYSIKKRFY